MRSVPEKDWKLLRTLKGEILKIACERIFQKIEVISKNRKDKEHQSYLELWNLIKNEDHKISKMFNDVKRSNALWILIEWRDNDLLSDEILEQFTEKTQMMVKL